MQKFINGNHGNETRTLGKKEEKKTGEAEMNFLRSTRGYSVTNQERNVDIRQEFYVQTENIYSLLFLYFFFYICFVRIH